MADKIEWGAGTDGPWHCVPKEHVVLVCTSTSREYSYATRVAECDYWSSPAHGQPDRVTALANARAIAEVPAMVAALRWYSDGFCELGPSHECCGRLGDESCSGCNARAILARIDGK